MTLELITERYAMSYGFDDINQMAVHYFSKGRIEDFNKHHYEISKRYAKAKLEEAARFAKIKKVDTNYSEGEHTAAYKIIVDKESILETPLD